MRFLFFFIEQKRILVTRPAKRSDGRQAEVADLPGTQRAGSSPLAGGPGVKRGCGQKVLLTK